MSGALVSRGSKALADLFLSLFPIFPSSLPISSSSSPSSCSSPFISRPLSNCACRSVEGAEDEKAPSAGAKSLCIPHDQARWGDVSGKKCPNCGKDAKRWTLFGRSCECISSSSVGWGRARRRKS